MATKKERRTEALPWVEKYRPKDLTQLVAHEEILSTISKLMDGDKFPHMLFYGPPGTGKTSTILAIAKKLYPTHMSAMTLELNASDDRKISIVRDQIKTFAQTRGLSGAFKLVILDEADAMTKDAQFALRRVMEKYTRNARFCLICNYVGKIIPALQSRCTRFRFAPLAEAQILGRFQEIVVAESVNITPDGVKAILRLAKGDMRKVLNVLQSTALAYDVVSEEHVHNCTATPLRSDITAILSSLLNDSVKEAFDKISALKEAKGIALSDLLDPIVQTLLSMKISDDVLMFLLQQFADLEHRLLFGTSEALQLGALVAAFSQARSMIKAEQERSGSMDVE